MPSAFVSYASPNAAWARWIRQSSKPSVSTSDLTARIGNSEIPLWNESMLS